MMHIARRCVTTAASTFGRPEHGSAAPASARFRSTIVAAIVAVGMLASGAVADRSIQVDVELAVRTAKLEDAVVSVSIHDADTGSRLAAIDPDQPMIVASNMKLLTTGAALHVLGADFRFRTQLLWDGSTLTILGDGDPAFADPLLLEQTTLGDRKGIDLDDLLDTWIAAIQEAGITSIDRVLVDDRVFDHEFVNAGWPADQLNRRYCAEVSGFNFNLNVVEIFLRPQDDRRPLIVGMSPNFDWLSVFNKATSRSTGSSRNTVWIARPPDTNQLTVFGNVRSPSGVAVATPVTIHDPAELFARLFSVKLDAAGVSVDAYGSPDMDDPLPDGTPVGPVISTPIATILLRCNRDSHNLFAEALLKRTGAAATNQPGTWSNGAAIIRHAIIDRLKNPQAIERIVIADGSGLSRVNRVKASTFTAWLDSFHQDPELGSAFIESLAVGGVDGTLRKRFQTIDLYGATVQAKSGFINEVSCLSGFVTMPDGRRRSFSVLVNGLKVAGSVGRAKKLQERIVEIIAQDMSRHPMVELGSDDR